MLEPPVGVGRHSSARSNPLASAAIRVGKLEASNSEIDADAAPTLLEGGPGRFQVATDRSDHSHPRHDDSALHETIPSRSIGRIGRPEASTD